MPSDRRSMNRLTISRSAQSWEKLRPAWRQKSCASRRQTKVLLPTCAKGTNRQPGSRRKRYVPSATPAADGLRTSSRMSTPRSATIEAQIAQDAGGRVVAVDADGAGPLVPEERQGPLGREVRRVDLVKGEASGRAEKRLRVSQDRFRSGVRENIDADRDGPVLAAEIMKQHEKLPGEDADLEHRSFDVRRVLGVEHIGGEIGGICVKPAGQFGYARFDETAVVRSKETGVRHASLPGIDRRMLQRR